MITTDPLYFRSRTAINLITNNNLRIPMHILKGDWNRTVSRNNRKKLAPCQCLDGHVKEPYEMSKAWKPYHKSNFFFSPPAHLCAVTSMTEILLIVTLNNQFTTIFKIQIHSLTQLPVGSTPQLSWQPRPCTDPAAGRGCSHPHTWWAYAWSACGFLVYKAVS